ncbi:MAG: hypothetical protein IPL46_24035 [Saprospiraceae bacterium]|nr:hypothetical protein [Saprospiraceae bacterium]
MKTLQKEYIDRLEIIKDAIQDSDELVAYLDAEEEEDYLKLQEKYERYINELYEDVAAADPLELFDLEERLIDTAFEGLFFPRLLGYAVLRGDLNESFKYVRPQEHFKKILIAMIDSPYFDLIKQRVGQAIQIGFALSSDIWITNLFEEIDNKNVKQFLNAQKIDRYHIDTHRKSGYLRFQKQFQTTNFQSTDFPATIGEMTSGFGLLRKFLEYRIRSGSNHSSYHEELLKLLENEKLHGKNHEHILSLVINFISFEGKQQDRLIAVLNKLRKNSPDLGTRYFELLHRHLLSDLPYDPTCDARVYQLLDHQIKDDMQAYYASLSVLAQKGFVHEDSKEAIKQLYGLYDGLSTINNCLRTSILKQFIHVLRNISEEEYLDYFELNKTLSPIWIYSIFSNLINH